MKRAIITGILLAGSCAPCAFGQSTDAPQFEVADVKVNTQKDPVPRKGGFLPGGKVDLPNGTFRQFLMMAYDVHSSLIVGGPKWIDSDRFDVVAKAPPDTTVPTLRLMLQALLADRFKLTIHREDRAIPAFALIAKDNSKLRQSKTSDRQGCTWHILSSTLARR
jgi:uncharacterized protein (TIGR03435 family)